MTLDPAVKADWMKALRSGRYTQCNGQLGKKDSETGKPSYCCLGVLVKRHANTKWRTPQTGELFQSPYLADDGCSGSPATKTSQALGLPDETVDDLIHMNDADGASFKQIADWIEANL